MASTITEQRVISSLIHEPELLLQVDKYPLRVSDFSSQKYKQLFKAIMRYKGATRPLTLVDLEEGMNVTNTESSSSPDNWLFDLATNNELYSCGNFEVIYNDLKKQNLITDLRQRGYDVSPYLAKTETRAGIETNDYTRLFHDSTIKDILEHYSSGIYDINQKYLIKDYSESESLYEGMEALLQRFQDEPELGLALQGDIFNSCINGAIRGRFYLRSSGSGVGKTRQAVGDACFLAFPLRYEWTAQKWVKTGACEKVLLIITEQSFDEARAMALAYLTGINESLIKKNNLTEKEREVIQQALIIMKEYESNFYIERVPAPNISIVEQIVRRQVENNGVTYVFYDYIFVSPSLLGEFRGINLRNDEILLMFSDALKRLAVDLDIFVMSSTQVNAKADDSKDIRNEASIAGSRAVINKADMGCIMARPTKEELKTLESITNLTEAPNIVTDIYKNRGAESTQVRIWSYVDLGTMRKKDLFITDSSLNEVEIVYDKINYIMDDEGKDKLDRILKGVNKV